MLREPRAVPAAESGSEQTTVAHEKVLSDLRFDILLGRLRPRERLLENELTQRFGVGRYLIRAVLAELQHLGLVEIRQNRGAVVKDPATSDVDHLYDLRAVLQHEAANRIPLPAGNELLEELEALNAEYFSSLANGELDQVVAANERFHRILFSACGNPFLAEMIEQLWQKTATIHCAAMDSPYRSGRSHQEHIEIIGSLRTGDRAALVRLCVDHMRPAFEAYKAAHGGWSAGSRDDATGGR